MLSSFVHGLFALLALVAAPSIAQPDIVKLPVQIAKGKTGTSIQGSVKGNQTVDYTLRAASGQTMSVMLSGGSSACHNVLPPGSSGEAPFVGSRDGNRSSITLPAPAEYTVRVYQMGDAASSGERSNFRIQTGNERYEIPEAVIFGG